MRWFLLLAAICLAIFTSSSIAASRHSTSKQTRHKSTSVRHHAQRRHTRRSRRAKARRYQLHPTAARYQQIQQALADKGYYDEKIDGKWGPESVAALQRFQTDHGIANEGKITALALIGLGLGPKHKHMTVPAVPAEMSPAANDSEANAGEREESKSLSPKNTAAANQ